MAKKKHYEIHKCPECGKDCMSEQDLTIHLKTHNKPYSEKKRNNSLKQGAKKASAWDDD